jgi:hypothetical protein
LKAGSNPVPYISQRFGRLVPYERVRTEGERGYSYHCKCDCGNDTLVRACNLRSGSTRSCGCLRREVMSNRRDENTPLREKQRYYKQNAKLRGYSWELSFDEFARLALASCHYCRGPGGGVDRVDNAIGYTIDNCVSCCSTCNTAKSDMNLQQFTTWIQSVYHALLHE